MTGCAVLVSNTNNIDMTITSTGILA